MTDLIPKEQLEQLQYFLAHGRTRSALELINLISHYRFTAIYRIAGESLDNLMIVDRQGTSPPRLERMPLNESYCVYVRDHLDAFLIRDADRDQRVGGHPKRPIVKAYCGVPLTRPDGSIFGTICHFDFDPVTDDPDAQSWLEQISDYFNPVTAAKGLIQGANLATDSLEAMLGLIVETSDDVEVATESFNDFATPSDLNYTRCLLTPPENLLCGWMGCALLSRSDLAGLKSTKGEGADSSFRPRALCGLARVSLAGCGPA